MNAKTRALAIRLNRKYMVPKAAHEAAMAAERVRTNCWRTALAKAHARELDELKKVMADLAKRTAHFTFEKGLRTERGGRYRCVVEFDPEMHGFVSSRPEHLAYLAEYVGNEVRHEIATARFVQSAYELEQERERKRHPETNPWNR